MNRDSAFVREWTGSELDIDTSHIDFQLLPDPNADNWMLDAILAGQQHLATLRIQAIFGCAVPTTHRFGRGDVLCEQLGRTARTRCLWLSDDPWAWAHGGSVDVDVVKADALIKRWEAREAERESLWVAFARNEDLRYDDLDATLKQTADTILEEYRTLGCADGAVLPKVDLCADQLNVIIARLFLGADTPPAHDWVSYVRRAGWIVENLIGGPPAPEPDQLDGWRKLLRSSVADPSTLKPRLQFLPMLWISYFAGTCCDELLEMAAKREWRAIRDSARLIKQLRENPSVGNVTLQPYTT